MIETKSDVKKFLREISRLPDGFEYEIQDDFLGRKSSRRLTWTPAGWVVLRIDQNTGEDLSYVWSILVLCDIVWKDRWSINIALKNFGGRKDD